MKLLKLIFMSNVLIICSLERRDTRARSPVRHTADAEVKKPDYIRDSYRRVKRAPNATRQGLERTELVALRPSELHRDRAAVPSDEPRGSDLDRGRAADPTWLGSGSGLGLGTG